MSSTLGRSHYFCISFHPKNRHVYEKLIKLAEINNQYRELNTSQIVIKALDAFLLQDPEKVQERIWERYRIGDIPLPEGLTLDNPLQAIMREELKQETFSSLCKKWNLTKQELASTLYWLIIIEA